MIKRKNLGLLNMRIIDNKKFVFIFLFIYTKKKYKKNKKFFLKEKKKNNFFFFKKRLTEQNLKRKIQQKLISKVNFPFILKIKNLNLFLNKKFLADYLFLLNKTSFLKNNKMRSSFIFEILLSLSFAKTNLIGNIIQIFLRKVKNQNFFIDNFVRRIVDSCKTLNVLTKGLKITVWGRFNKGNRSTKITIVQGVLDNANLCKYKFDYTLLHSVTKSGVFGIKILYKY